MMNQEIEKSSNKVVGSELEREISGLSWSNINGYYPMTYPTDITGQELKGHLNTNSPDGELVNITTWQKDTMPLPYVTVRDGDWDKSDSTTPGSMETLFGMNQTV